MTRSARCWCSRARPGRSPRADVAAGGRHRPVGGRGAPRRAGRLALARHRVRRRDRHLAARRRAEDRGRRRHRADVRDRRAPLRSRRRREVAPARHRDAGSRALAAGLRDTEASVAERRALVDATRRSTCSPLGRSRSSRPTRPSTRSSSSADARASAPGTSSSRARRARGGSRTARGRAAPSAPPPSGSTAVAAMGFDVVYLPPIHPIGAPNRKGRNNTLDPRPRRSRLAVGDRRPPRAATTPSTPISARSPTSARSSRRAARRASRWRSTSRCRPRPTTRGSRSIPEWFTHAARRHDRATPRTRRRSTRTSTRSTSTTIPRASRDEALRRRAALDRAGRADLPRRQPAHQAAAVLGVADRDGLRPTHPDVVFLAEAFTRPAMMQRAREGRLPAVVHVLHLAEHQAGARGVPHRARARHRATSCGPTSS